MLAEDRVIAIVEERIQLYAKDRTGMRNFAHAFTGADIIRPLTSATFISPQSPVEAVAWEPEIVISPGLEAGRCWSFSGSKGYIGISLADRIVVTNITIEHISLDLAPQTDTAPRDLIVWGFVEDTTKLQDYRYILRDDAAFSTAFPIPSSSMPREMAVQNFIPLLNFTYDLYAEDFLQTFTVHPHLLAISAPVRHVVVDVQTNWGNEVQTCLYRVRIHGVRYNE